MQEFRVIANNYSAEFGHSTGGIVTMSTRSGTNQYHGSLFESLQNNVFNARNSLPRRGRPIRLNQYGGSFGGPDPQGQDAFLRHLGADTGQLTSFDTDLHRPDAAQPRRRFLGPAQHRRQADPDLRSRHRPTAPPASRSPAT